MFSEASISPKLGSNPPVSCLRSIFVCSLSPPCSSLPSNSAGSLDDLSGISVGPDEFYFRLTTMFTWLPIFHLDKGWTGRLMGWTQQTQKVVGSIPKVWVEIGASLWMFL